MDLIRRRSSSRKKLGPGANQCIIVTIVLSLVTIARIVVYRSHSLKDFASSIQHDAVDDNGNKVGRSEFNCRDIEQHMQGHWQHKSALTEWNSSYEYNSSSYHFDYLPEEVDWLHGKSDDWRGGCSMGAYQKDKRGYMFASPMGNQCGCGTSTFMPVDSQWMWNRTTHESKDRKGHYYSFQLVEQLAKTNKTMCFVGDSIDLQFYTALVNNILRTQLFESSQNSDRMPKVSVDQRLIPVVYSNETTGPLDYAKYWMCMQQIQETIVSIDYNNGVIHNARLRYYKVHEKLCVFLLKMSLLTVDMSNNEALFTIEY
jgi:hypothetical protein